MNGEDTHNKKRNSQFANQYKGATPIEKNVRVIDEQGNEYEATYPKRAKGLVKNGRARFIDEHTLCLACPPNEYMEDKQMEENQTLTAKEVFDQIVKLQTVLVENSNHSLHRIGDAFESAFNYTDFDLSGEERSTAIGQITSVFVQREYTLQKMLAIYERIYDDIVNAENQAFASQADVIQKSFQDISACISNAELNSEDRYAALCEISDYIRGLLSDLIKKETKPE